MPELPEVETIRRALSEHLPGRSIVKIQVRDARLRWPVDETRLRQLLLAQAIVGVKRRAKYLIVEFEQDSCLILHLGMSGQLLFLTERQPFHKHDHVIFTFNDETQLRFRDPRRFGMVDASAPGRLREHPRLVNLGLEPLHRGTTFGKLHQRAATLQRPVKNLLMDAGFIVGVGNIYASEALFYAGIHPATPAAVLSETDWRTLLGEIRKVLRRAIRKGGTTLNDFVDSNGETGYFQLSLAVYGREGEGCQSCNTQIERLVQVGRSSFFCPSCQRPA